MASQKEVLLLSASNHCQTSPSPSSYFPSSPNLIPSPDTKPYGQNRLISHGSSFSSYPTISNHALTFYDNANIQSQSNLTTTTQTSLSPTTTYNSYNLQTKTKTYKEDKLLQSDHFYNLHKGTLRTDGTLYTDITLAAEEKTSDIGLTERLLHAKLTSLETT